MPRLERIPGTGSETPCRIYPLPLAGEGNASLKGFRVEPTRGRGVGLAIFTLRPIAGSAVRRAPRMRIVRSGGPIEGRWTAA